MLLLLLLRVLLVMLRLHLLMLLLLCACVTLNSVVAATAFMQLLTTTRASACPAAAADVYDNDLSSSLSTSITTYHNHCYHHHYHHCYHHHHHQISPLHDTRAVQSYRATSYFLEPLDAPRAAVPSPFAGTSGECDSAGDSFIPRSVPQTPSNAKRGLFSLDGERLEYGGIGAVVMPAAARVLSL